MDRLFQSDINWRAVGKNEALTPMIREHLGKVYSTLSILILTAAMGTITEMKTHFISSTIALFATVGLLVWFHTISQVELAKRFLVLLSIAFLQGFFLGPLVTVTLDIDPSIVATAFLGTTAIFACFSGMSLFAERRSYLYIGGLLSSGLSLLLVLSFANIFFRSIAIFNIHLYLGLMVFCGFVVFDTQLIIEKRFLGDRDFLKHALELFLDFVGIFVRLLIILSKNKKSNEKKSNSRR